MTNEENNNRKEQLSENEETPEVGESDNNTTAQNPEEEIIKLKEQITALEEKSLRAMAEAENTRIRCNKQIDEAKSYAIFSFAKDLIGVMDNLARAIEYAPKEGNGQPAGVIEGVIMTKKELESVFDKHGLQSINPLIGERFDYNLHSAISQIATDEYEQDSIVAVMQTGYKIRERLLRPAVVTVAKKHDKQEQN